MARLPGLVLPCIPHHVTQQGNGWQWTFSEDGDQALHLGLLTGSAERAQCAIWSCCLMPNHGHIVLTRNDEHDLAGGRF